MAEHDRLADEPAQRLALRAQRLDGALEALRGASRVTHGAKVPRALDAAPPAEGEGGGAPGEFEKSPSWSLIESAVLPNEQTGAGGGGRAQGGGGGPVQRAGGLGCDRMPERGEGQSRPKD